MSRKDMVIIMIIKGVKSRFIALSVVFAVIVGSFSLFVLPMSGADGVPVVEFLNRGIVAVRARTGIFVSWRHLASDPDDAVYRLYRDGTLIHTTSDTGATCFNDTSGTITSVYRVDAVSGNTVYHSEDKVIRANTFLNNQTGGGYFDIPISKPSNSHHANDLTVGDVDGDGEYEIFIKWEPDNAKDNSQSGTTDNVFIDCIKLDGTLLWRIDLGRNIRAGAHYTQMLVADYDLSGSAKLIVKTADGTRDGLGNVIGNANADHRNSSGYILSGPEYLTLFDGKTGANLHTIDYKPGRGNVNAWGDNYGNRVDRFLGAVAYLDGVKPSAVLIRGYYTRMTATAYDVVNDRLVEKWAFDSGNNSSAQGYGQGNHNCMPAALGNDSRQSIVLGSCAIGPDGTMLWDARQGHGDALHVGNFIPERPGVEVFMCHENSPFGVSLKSNTGEVLWRSNGSSDTGRGAAGNIFAGNNGAEFWGSQPDGVLNTSGQRISGMPKPTINHLIWWNGELERQFADGTGGNDSNLKIERINAAGTGIDRVFTTVGDLTINGTKKNPGLTADLFGDWREEIVLRTADSSALRVYSTVTPTSYRITTLMHDPQYRNQVAGQNVCYNQPPHPSFFLGMGHPLPKQPNVVVRGQGGDSPITTTATETTTSATSTATTTATTATTATSTTATTATSATTTTATSTATTTATSTATTTTASTATTTATSATTTTATSTATTTATSTAETTETTDAETSSHGIQPLLGDTDGNGRVTIADALELLKHLAGMSSLVSQDNPELWVNSLITPASQAANKPAIADVLEILKYLARMSSLVSGERPT